MITSARFASAALGLFCSLLVFDGCAGDEVLLFRYVRGSAGGALGSDADAALDAGGAAGSPSSGGRRGTMGGAPGRGGGGGRSVSGGGPGSGGATVIDGGAGASDGGSFLACTTEADCPPTWTCSKPGCAAPTGQCEPRPIFCDPSPAPVCGCDHVTYWNDCVRRQNGMPASTFGECGAGARSCTTASDCGVSTATCSHVQPPSFPCGPEPAGTCWVTPLDCAGLPPTSTRWTLCPLPPFGTTPTCVDACTAIRSGQQYVPVSPGTQCN
jgi:hypothetical protein